MEVSKLIGTVVVKKEPVPSLWVHDPFCARVVPGWVKHPLLPVECCLSGVPPGMNDTRPQYSAESEGRVGAEISTIHIGIQRVGVVVYPV